MTLSQPFNRKPWIDAHRDLLPPPQGWASLQNHKSL